MADEGEETKKDYIVIKRNTVDELVNEVNAKIKEKYIPYWAMMFQDGLYIQTMITTELLTKMELTIKTVKAVGVVAWIWWTVNVSWCECNCG